MPWRETCTIDERMGFIATYQWDEVSVAAPPPPPEPSPIKGEGPLNADSPYSPIPTTPSKKAYWKAQRR